MLISWDWHTNMYTACDLVIYARLNWHWIEKVRLLTNEVRYSYINIKLYAAVQFETRSFSGRPPGRAPFRANRTSITTVDTGKCNPPLTDSVHARCGTSMPCYSKKKRNLGVWCKLGISQINLISLFVNYTHIYYRGSVVCIIQYQGSIYVYICIYMLYTCLWLT